jgi:hypothetical protein
MDVESLKNYNNLWRGALVASVFLCPSSVEFFSTRILFWAEGMESRS